MDSSLFILICSSDEGISGSPKTGVLSNVFKIVNDIINIINIFLYFPCISILFAVPDFLLLSFCNYQLSFRPIATIQTAVAYGFGYMMHLDVLLAFEVGNGAGYFEDAAVGTG